MNRTVLAYPAPLRPGDSVAVVAPASAPRDPDKARAGIDRLNKIGYRIEVAYDPAAAHGYLAASDAERLRTLNTCFARPDVKAIVCVRGGYGSLRLLPDLDYEAARTHPKLLIGYSDITALHLALYHNAGWPGLSSLVATEWGQADVNTVHHFKTLAEGGMMASLAGPNDETLYPIRPGTAEGPLLGGNLSVLTRLLGTPYCPSFEEAILFLEEVGEEPYRIDRMLAHLDLAGVLDELGGVVLGHFHLPDPSASNTPTLPLDEIMVGYFGDRPYPVARGLVYGHCLPRLTMPIGVRARLTVNDQSARLSMLEAVTR